MAENEDDYNDYGYDNRYIVQHPSAPTPRNSHSGYRQPGWDSPGYYPPRRTQHQTEGPPQYPASSSSSFFPKAPQKNKRSGEPWEGEEEQIEKGEECK